jgi:hypothetical protein
VAPIIEIPSGSKTTFDLNSTSTPPSNSIQISASQPQPTPIDTQLKHTEKKITNQQKHIVIVEDSLVNKFMKYAINSTSTRLIFILCAQILYCLFACLLVYLFCSRIKNC